MSLCFILLDYIKSYKTGGMCSWSMYIYNDIIMFYTCRLYKVIGPAACGVGVCILIAAVMYYFCYGLSDTTRSRHQSVRRILKFTLHGCLYFSIISVNQAV